MHQNEVIELVNNLVEIPEGFELKHFKQVKHDETPVIWVRFIKEGCKDDYGVEHFSLTIDPENKQLKGLMWLDKSLDCDDYIQEDEAKKLAMAFLTDNAPDLLETIEVRWIRPTRKKPEQPPHDEGFYLSDGTIITGMRVKMWANDTQKYAWVIINASGQVISFERDIVWNSEKHCRSTERWLHDHWLEEQAKGDS